MSDHGVAIKDHERKFHEPGGNSDELRQITPRIATDSNLSSERQKVRFKKKKMLSSDFKVSARIRKYIVWGEGKKDIYV